MRTSQTPAQPISRPRLPTARRARRRSIAWGFWASLVTLGITAALILMACGILGFYAYFQASQLILPGVAVGDVQLGGKTFQQAAIELNSAWNLSRRVTIADGLHTWTVAPAEIGVELDPLRTAQEAMSVGHGQSPLAELGQMAYSLQNGWQVTPVIVFDTSRARAWLENAQLTASKAPLDARVLIQDGQVSLLPGELGYTINLEATLEKLAADPTAVLLAGYWPVELMPVPPQIVDLSGLHSQIQGRLDTPFQVQAYDPIRDQHYAWELPRSTLGELLVVVSGEAGPQVSLDPDGVSAFLASRGQELGEGLYFDLAQDSQSLAESFASGQPVTLRVRHAPTSYVVRPGDTLLRVAWQQEIPFWMIIQANPGLDPDNLLAGQTLTIPSKDDLLPLPIVPGKRIVISISKQRLWVYENGELRSKHVISTGIDRSPTQPGVFQVRTHERRAYASVWDLTMPHFLGIYEAWPGFMNGLHGLPTLSSGQRLWAGVLGRPVSYGCIVLELDAAENLYNWAENGVVVEIQP